MVLLHRLGLCGLVLAAASGLCERQARGQGTANVAQDIAAVIAEGQRGREQAGNHLGVIHGAVERPFARVAGADEARLGEQLPAARSLDILQGASQALRPGADISADRRPGILPPALPAAARPEVPLYGPLSVPAAEDEGPADGLTLEQAIVQLVRANPDLAVRFQELPKADADILTASLYGNPLITAGANSVPYGSYSQRRPGTNNYNISIVQPFDLNGKIRARTRLARANKEVLCAMYQDAVRLEVELLHAAFVDVLAARTTVRYLQTSVDNFAALLKTAEDRVRRGAAPKTELDTALIQRETTVNAQEEAITRLRQAKRNLAVLLGLSPAQADAIEPRGTLHDRAPAPPAESLVALAVRNRPDLAANRLGVRSALANVDVQRRERFADVFALYTPYQFEPNDEGDPSTRGATSWGAGVFVSVPLWNRNQGNIRRADRNVMQTKIEVAGLERLVAAEVENAALEYGSSRGAVERIEREILPRAGRRLEDIRRLYTEGQENLDAYLNAQRDFNEVIRQYRDALIRHRRAMLALNTAVGLRVLP